eukprot:Rmarinus@m.16044
MAAPRSPMLTFCCFIFLALSGICAEPHDGSSGSFQAVNVGSRQLQHYFTSCVRPESGDIMTEFYFYMNTNHNEPLGDWSVVIAGATDVTVNTTFGIYVEFPPDSECGGIEYGNYWYRYGPVRLNAGEHAHQFVDIGGLDSEIINGPVVWSEEVECVTNECLTGEHNCDPHASCNDVTGGFTCSCNIGYSGDGTECGDVNECLEDVDNCSQWATCTNTEGSFSCECPLGFGGDGSYCGDLDECLYATHDCPVETVCVNSEGSFQCDCGAGYAVSDGACADVNECTSSLDSCVGLATCTNTVGSFGCSCSEGYTLSHDGIDCLDVDECIDGLHQCSSAGGVCLNADGSFTCNCDIGYSGDGLTCTNDDECTSDTANCNANADCTDTVGSFSCACNLGFSGDGISCVDDDECELGIDDCVDDAVCTNTQGSFTCPCTSGLEGDGTSACSNVDECALALHGCAQNATCQDTVGSFACACDAGYEGDGVYCGDLDECLAGTHACEEGGPVCVNTPGSYSCDCPIGYELSTDTTCMDIDECRRLTHSCHSTASCVNSAGSFQCVCALGAVEGGVSCTTISGSSSCDIEMAEVVVLPEQVDATATAGGLAEGFVAVLNTGTAMSTWVLEPIEDSAKEWLTIWPEGSGYVHPNSAQVFTLSLNHTIPGSYSTVLNWSGNWTGEGVKWGTVNFEVSAADVDESHSYVVAAQTKVTAGQDGPFEIVTYDQYGNERQEPAWNRFVITDSLTGNQWLSVGQEGSGVEVFTLYTTVAGSRELAVTYDDVGLSNSPVAIEVVPAALSSTTSQIWFEGVSCVAEQVCEYLPAGSVNTFTLIGVDEFGNKRTSADSSIVLFTVTSQTGTVIQNGGGLSSGDGSYRITVTSGYSGFYEVTVNINYVIVELSCPFIVMITPTDASAGTSEINEASIINPTVGEEIMITLVVSDPYGNVIEPSGDTAPPFEDLAASMVLLEPNIAFPDAVGYTVEGYVTSAIGIVAGECSESFVAVLNTTISGLYQLSATYQGNAFENSPVNLTVSAAAGHAAGSHVVFDGTECEPFALCGSDFTAGLNYTYAIASGDEFGNALGRPAEPFLAELYLNGALFDMTISESHTDPVVETFIFSASQAGTYSVKVSLDGVEVPQSPFYVTVLEAGTVASTSGLDSILDPVTVADAVGELTVALRDIFGNLVQATSEDIALLTGYVEGGVPTDAHESMTSSTVAPLSFALTEGAKSVHATFSTNVSGVYEVFVHYDSTVIGSQLWYLTVAPASVSLEKSGVYYGWTRCVYSSQCGPIVAPPDQNRYAVRTFDAYGNSIDAGTLTDGSCTVYYGTTWYTAEVPTEESVSFEFDVALGALGSHVVMVYLNEEPLSNGYFLVEVSSAYCETVELSADQSYVSTNKTSTGAAEDVLSCTPAEPCGQTLVAGVLDESFYLIGMNSMGHHLNSSTGVIPTYTTTRTGGDDTVATAEDDGLSRSLMATDLGDGTFELPLQLFTAGEHLVTVHIGGADVANSGFYALVTPNVVDPITSYVESLLSGGDVGECVPHALCGAVNATTAEDMGDDLPTTIFLVTLRDSYENELLDASNEVVEFLVHSNEDAPLEAATFVSDAVWKFVVFSTISGEYAVTVTVSSEPVSSSEFLVFVVPGSTEASTSYVVGCEDETLDTCYSSTAGTGALVVQSADMYGNSRQVASEDRFYLASSSGHYIFAEDGRDGTSWFDLSAFTVSGLHEVSVTYEGVEVSGSPFSVELLPGNANATMSSVLYVDELHVCDSGMECASLVAGDTSTFQIIARDVYGNTLEDAQAEDETVLYAVTVVSTGVVQERYFAEYSGQGLFSFSLILTEAAAHAIDVYVGESQALCSSFTVAVFPSTVDALSSELTNTTVDGYAGLTVSAPVITRDRFTNLVTISSNDTTTLAAFEFSLLHKQSGARYIGEMGFYDSDETVQGILVTTLSGLYEGSVTYDGALVSGHTWCLYVRAADPSLSNSVVTFGSTVCEPSAFCGGSIVAGLVATYTAVLKDEFGNTLHELRGHSVAYHPESLGTAADASSAIGQEDGTFAVVIQLYEVAEYRILVYLDDSELSSSGFVVNVVTASDSQVSPTLSTVSSVALQDECDPDSQQCGTDVDAGSGTSYLLTQRDIFGNVTTTSSGLLCSFFVETQSSLGVGIDNGNGTFTLAISVTTAGYHAVTVYLGTSVVGNSGFYVHIVPGTLHPQSSYVLDCSVDAVCRTQAAGTSVTLVVQAADVYGNELLALSEDCQYELVPDNSDATGTWTTAINNGDGTYSVEANVTVAGAVFVHVAFWGQSVSNSPVWTEILAGSPVAQESSLDNCAVREVCVSVDANEEHSLPIYLRDGFGNLVVDDLVLVTPPTFAIYRTNITDDVESVWSVGEVLDTGSAYLYGTSFEIAFQLTTAGTHSLEVLYDNSPISTSPVLITVAADEVEPTLSVVYSDASLSDTFVCERGRTCGNSLVSGASQTYTLAAFDSYGNRVTSVGRSWVAVLEINGVQTSGKALGEGLFSLTVALTIAAEHEALVYFGADEVLNSGFVVEVVPSAFDPTVSFTDCTLGQSCDDLELYAGEESPLFTVYAVDTYGNLLGESQGPLEVVGLPSASHSSQLVSIDNGDGTYTYAFELYLSGGYDLFFYIGGNLIGSSNEPVQVTVVPSTFNASVSYVQIESGVNPSPCEIGIICGESISPSTSALYRLITSDSYGNTLLDEAGAATYTLIDSSNNSTLQAYYRLSYDDSEPGTYHLEIPGEKTGSYGVIVDFNGEVISNSGFLLVVEQRIPEVDVAVQALLNDGADLDVVLQELLESLSLSLGVPIEDILLTGYEVVEATGEATTTAPGDRRRGMDDVRRRRENHNTLSVSYAIRSYSKERADELSKNVEKLNVTESFASASQGYEVVDPVDVTDVDAVEPVVSTELTMVYPVTDLATPCEPELPCLEETVPAGNTVQFVVKAVDVYGNPLGYSSDTLCTFATTVEVDGVVLESLYTAIDNTDGSYTVQFRQTISGVYTVEVMLGSSAYSDNPISNSGFLVEVGPASETDPQRCTITGDILDGVAGALNNFSIQARDVFGNARGGSEDVFLVSFTGLSTDSAWTQLAAPVGDGAYLVAWNTTISQEYFLTVSLDGEPVSTMPEWDVVVVPDTTDPNGCELEGAVEASVVGENSMIVIYARDRWGNGQVHNDDAFEAMINSTVDTGQLEITALPSKSDGTYTFTFQPSLDEAGPHELYVRLVGFGDLPGTPVQLNIMCPAGYYLASETSECIRCSTGMVCDMSGVTVDAVGIEPNYWRVSPSSTDIFECLNTATYGGAYEDCRGRGDNAAEGGGDCHVCIGIEMNDENWVNAAGPDYQCALGYTGALCGACALGYHRSMRAFSCSECASNTQSMSALTGSFFAYALMISVFLTFEGAPAPRGPKRARTAVFRMLITFVQTLSMIRLIAVDWPDSVAEYLQGQTAVLPTSEYLPLDCALDSVDGSPKSLYFDEDNSEGPESTPASLTRRLLQMTESAVSTLTESSEEETSTFDENYFNLGEEPVIFKRLRFYFAVPYLILLAAIVLHLFGWAKESFMYSHAEYVRQSTVDATQSKTVGSALSRRFLWSSSDELRASDDMPAPPPPFKRVAAHFFATVTVLYFLFYPAISVEYWKMFACKTVGETQYLTWSTDVICFESDHSAGVAIASIAIVVFVFGVPFGAGSLVMLARRAIYMSESKGARQSIMVFSDALGFGSLSDDMAKLAHTTRMATKNALKKAGRGKDRAPRGSFVNKMVHNRYTKWLSVLSALNEPETLAFVTHGYRTRLFWWEAVVATRKCALAFIAGMMAQNDPNVQAAVALLVLVAALLAQTMTMPYSEPLLNHLEILSISSSIFTLSGAALFEIADIGDSGRTAVAVFVVMADVFTFLCLLLSYLRMLGRTLQLEEGSYTAKLLLRVMQRFKYFRGDGGDECETQRLNPSTGGSDCEEDDAPRRSVTFADEVEVPHAADGNASDDSSSYGSDDEAGDCGNGSGKQRTSVAHPTPTATQPRPRAVESKPVQGGGWGLWASGGSMAKTAPAAGSTPAPAASSAAKPATGSGRTETKPANAWGDRASAIGVSDSHSTPPPIKNTAASGTRPVASAASLGQGDDTDMSTRPVSARVTAESPRQTARLDKKDILTLSLDMDGDVGVLPKGRSGTTSPPPEFVTAGKSAAHRECVSEGTEGKGGESGVEVPGRPTSRPASPQRSLRRMSPSSRHTYRPSISSPPPQRPGSDAPRSPYSAPRPSPSATSLPPYFGPRSASPQPRRSGPPIPSSQSPPHVVPRPTSPVPFRPGSPAANPSAADHHYLPAQAQPRQHMSMSLGSLGASGGGVIRPSRGLLPPNRSRSGSSSSGTSFDVNI